MSWTQDDEALLCAYERLREIPQSRLLEILSEWEMKERFGPSADHVWADEWPKAVARVESRYRATKFRPDATALRMVGGVWSRAFALGGYEDPDEACLCPYGCMDHRVSIAPAIGSQI